LERTVANGFAQIPGLPGAALGTSCASGPAMALIRPHEVGLLPGPGPVLVESVHSSGQMHRVRVLVGRQALEVLCAQDAWLPQAGQTCGIDLSRARFYPLDDAAPPRQRWPEQPAGSGCLVAPRQRRIFSYNCHHETLYTSLTGGEWSPPVSECYE
jgi:hypothetical protein